MESESTQPLSSASITLNLSHPNPLQTVYCAISRGGACALLTEKSVSSSGEFKLASFSSGEKIIYHARASGLSVTVTVWAESPSKAEEKARELAEKVKLVSQQDTQLATIIEELDRATALALTQAPKRQVYQLVADARERIILTFNFHPITLQMSEILNHLSHDQDSPIDVQTAKTTIERIFKWKKQLTTL